MTISIEALTPIVDGAPGVTAIGQVSIFNDAPTATTVSIRVVGLASSSSPVGPPTANAGTAFTIEVAANEMVECSVPVPVPEQIAPGQHAAAFEATSSRAGDRPSLGQFLLVVESIAHVDMVIEPVPIRGRRRAKFALTVGNSDSVPVSFAVDGEAAEVSVRFKSSAFRLLPGERASTRARVRGPRLLVGEPTQHNLVIAARGKASATTITAPFIQRPLFAHRARGLVAALAVVALFLSGIAGVLVYRDRVNNGSNTAGKVVNAALIKLEAPNGEALDDGPYVAQADGTILDADGNLLVGFTVDAEGNLLDQNGQPIAGVEVESGTNVLVDSEGTPLGLPPLDADGNPVGGSDPGEGDGGSGGPNSNGAPGSPGTSGTPGNTGGQPVTGVIAATPTIFRGSISAAGTTDISDIDIFAAPLKPGDEPSENSVELDTTGQSDAGVPDQTSASKLWSAAVVAPLRGIGTIRQTEPIRPTGIDGLREADIDENGLWRIPNLPLRQTYEVSFSKPGFDTQSYVVSPPDDGTAVELDVVLEPAVGALAGQVLSNGVGLGGVEIELSDGTLTFTTTSATDGDEIGAFSFAAVSTPNIYTLSATRSGFSTAVVQVPLTAGEPQTDLAIEMQEGVASISGIVVDERSQVIRGAKVTATNGDIVRSSNSLTDGAAGTYNIPQLDINQSYTVTVEFAGYGTETRRIQVDRNVAGVTFRLASDTSQLNGSITSAGGPDLIRKTFIRSGSGINRAGITLNNGALEFKSSTNIAGEFSVPNIPPGTYTVSVDHFQHDPVTTLIDVVPGVDPDRLVLSMPVSDDVIDVGTGDLEVKVVNAAPKRGESSELTDATVTMRNTETEEIVVRESGEDSSIREPGLRVGTYEVTVVKEGFEPKIQLVSVPQNGTSVVIELLGFGAVDGLMVDAFTGEAVTGYNVQFRRVSGNVISADPVVGASFSVQLNASDPTWSEAPERALNPGRYLITISDGPNGYQAPADQILSPGLPPMQIDIGFNGGEPTQVPVLSANRYPDIFGRVYAPRLVGGPQAPGTGTQFASIDSASLAATMSCNNGAKIPMTVSKFGQESADQFDALFLDRDDVKNNQLLGSCKIEVSAAGYVPSVVELPDVAVSSATTLSDRVVTLAMHRPVEELDGTVFWIDPRGNQTVPLADVDISTTAVTSFSTAYDFPQQIDSKPNASRPNTATEVISTKSQPDGSWTFGAPNVVAPGGTPQQVFSGARYTFKKFGFADGLIDVVINENLQRIVTDVSGVVLAELDGLIKVELTPPNDGRVFGTLDIKSVKSPADRDFDGAVIVVRDPSGTIDATGRITPVKQDPLSPECAPPPVGGAVTPTGLCLERTGADLQVRNAAAGTWTFDFVEPPPNHVFATGAPTMVQELLNPETELGVFQTTFVELGNLEVELVTDANVGINSNEIELSLPGGLSTNETFPTGAAGGKFYRADGIAVNLASPATPVGYTLNVIAPGYDRSTSRVFLNDVELTGVRADAIPLTFEAGSSPKVRIVLESFGTITTSVFGESPVTPLNDPNELELVYRKVDVNGNTDGAGTALAGPVFNTDGTISISGPEGYYEFSVRHINYKLAPTATPSGGTCSPSACEEAAQITPAGATAGVFWLQNDSNHMLSNRFQLDILDSRIDLTVLESLASGALPAGAAVGDALYELRDMSGALLSSDPVGASGVIAITTVPGDMYELRVAGQAANRFPVTVTFNVPTSVRTNPVGNVIDVGVVTITAPLPLATASIGGSTIGRSASGQPVPIPPVQVRLAYDAPTILVDENDGDPNNNTRVNENARVNDVLQTTTAVPDPLVANPALPPTDPNRGRATFTFAELVGSSDPSIHTLTFPTIAGYNPPTVALPYVINATGEVIVNDLGVAEPRVLPDITYTATNVKVIATIGVAGDVYPNLVVQLQRPNGGALINPDVAPDTTQNLLGPVIVEFSNTEPHIDPYTLIVNDALHTTPNLPVVVPVDTAATGEFPILTVPATADAGRVTGSVGLIDTLGGAPLPLDAAAEVCLRDRDTEANIVPCQPGTMNTTYSFDAPAGTNYQVVLRRNGYTTATENVNLIAGRLTPQNLSIAKLSPFSVVLLPPGATGAQVTYFRIDPPAAPRPFVAEFEKLDPATGLPFAAGAFTGLLPEGDYQIFVEGGSINDFFWQNGASFDVDIGQTSSRNVVIPRSVNVEGFLRDAAGNLVGGAQITVTNDGGITVPSVTTDADNTAGNMLGRFIFPGLTNRTDDGLPVNYTFDADIPGTGVITSGNALEVSAFGTVPANPGSFDLNMIARPQTVNIDLEAAGSEDFGTTSVSLEGFPTQPTTDAGANVQRVTYTIPENQDALTIAIVNDLYKLQPDPVPPLSNAEINAGAANRTVVPKVVNVAFTANGSQAGSPPVQNFSVSYGPPGGPATTMSTTTGTVNLTGVPVTFGQIDWTLTATGSDADDYLPVPMQSTLLGTTDGANLTATVPALAFIPVPINLTGAALAAGESYTVQYCGPRMPPTSNAPCGASPTNIGSGLTNPNAISLDQPPADGTYRLEVFVIDAMGDTVRDGSTNFVTSGHTTGRPIAVTVT